jgi:hypothetical protein
MSNDVAALVRFTVPFLVITDLGNQQDGSAWKIPSDRIAGLNKALRGSIEVIARRDATSTRYPNESPR